jgi:3-methyladenine DNA glycosylase/8-oxoguanine DNA glycosylase
MSRPAGRMVRLEHQVDLVSTLGVHRHGTGDPTIRLGATRVALSMRTPEGPATLALGLDARARAARAEAWGPGAAWALETAPDLLGAGDPRESFDPAHGIVRELHRRQPGLRLSRSNRVLAALVPAVFEQKVTGREARRAWRTLVRDHGEPAPGPHGLALAPAPPVLAELPYPAFHRFGVEQRRAETVRRAASRAARLEAAAGDGDRVQQLLRAIPGVGAWTVAEVAMAALGDADAVSVGDFHLKHHVVWVLAGERGGTDEQMLELLEPYRPHRGRVCRLISAAAPRPERRSPRMAARAIAWH